ncbi:MAG: hypothetical protein ACRBBW_10050 [Cellvibrionaceae bacterium]
MKTFTKHPARLFGVIFFVLGVSACQPQPVKPTVDQTQQQAQEKKRQIERQQAHKRRIQAMLQRAEFQLGRDRLTTPRYDSAYGLFTEVLKLQPENQQAKSGLQLVAIRYIQLARKALAHSNLARAGSYYAQARRIAPNNPLLAEFDVAYQQALAAKEQWDQRSEIALAPGALSRRDDEVLGVLQEVANRVKVSDESLVIIARNDAEGRWLYQQMRKAAEGYRIRGDIQLGAVPKIVIQPPIH